MDMTVSPKVILWVLGVVLFFIASAGWWGTPDFPHRTRLIAAGLFCCALSVFFKG